MNALNTCEAVLMELRENEEVASADIEAAGYILIGLEKLIAGKQRAYANGHLIGQDSSIGKWLVVLGKTKGEKKCGESCQSLC